MKLNTQVKHSNSHLNLNTLLQAKPEIPDTNLNTYLKTVQTARETIKTFQNSEKAQVHKYAPSSITQKLPDLYGPLSETPKYRQQMPFLSPIPGFLQASSKPKTSRSSRNLMIQKTVDLKRNLNSQNSQRVIKVYTSGARSRTTQYLKYPTMLATNGK